MVELKQQVGLTVVPEVERWPKKQPTPSTTWQLENQSLKTVYYIKESNYGTKQPEIPCYEVWITFTFVPQFPYRCRYTLMYLYNRLGLMCSLSSVTSSIFIDVY